MQTRGGGRGRGFRGMVRPMHGGMGPFFPRGRGRGGRGFRGMCRGRGRGDHIMDTPSDDPSQHPNPEEFQQPPPRGHHPHRGHFPRPHPGPGPGAHPRAMRGIDHHFQRGGRGFHRGRGRGGPPP